jgi:hypothetical protein
MYLLIFYDFENEVFIAGSEYKTETFSRHFQAFIIIIIIIRTHFRVLSLTTVEVKL